MSGPAVLHTVGEIAHKLGVPLHRVEYLIRARGIRPSSWAGNARVFSDKAVERIARELGHPKTQGPDEVMDSDGRA